MVSKALACSESVSMCCNSVRPSSSISVKNLYTSSAAALPSASCLAAILPLRRKPSGSDTALAITGVVFSFLTFCLFALGWLKVQGWVAILICPARFAASGSHCASAKASSQACFSACCVSVSSLVFFCFFF